MPDVTQILSRIEGGDSSAAEQLLPLVYEELKRLAARQLSREKPGQTLQATDLVHEAFVRLVDEPTSRKWDNRGHFFAAAAEAMRRILVDAARRRASGKHGGEFQRLELLDPPAADVGNQVDLLDLNDALTQLEREHPEKAQLVKLRYFTGCTLDQSAQMLGISRSTAERNWLFARAWLYGKLKEAESRDPR